MIVCWSSKGGVGTTVVAAGLASLAGSTHPAGALLVDLAGDADAALGVRVEGPGLSAWLAGGAEVPPDALARLEVPVGPGLALLPRGTGALAPQRAEALRSVLAADHRPVVVDAGVVDVDGRSGLRPAGAQLAAGAETSLLVVRPCYLALRRATACEVRPTGVVVVVEDGRALSLDDVEAALQVPVVAAVRVTERIARTVDAGLLHRRLPRSLARDLRHAA